MRYLTLSISILLILVHSAFAQSSSPGPTKTAIPSNSAIPKATSRPTAGPVSSPTKAGTQTKVPTRAPTNTVTPTPTRCDDDPNYFLCKDPNTCCRVEDEACVDEDENKDGDEKCILKTNCGANLCDPVDEKCCASPNEPESRCARLENVCCSDGTSCPKSESCCGSGSCCKQGEECCGGEFAQCKGEKDTCCSDGHVCRNGNICCGNGLGGCCDQSKSMCCGDTCCSEPNSCYLNKCRVIRLCGTNCSGDDINIEPYCCNYGFDGGRGCRGYLRNVKKCNTIELYGDGHL